MPKDAQRIQKLCRLIAKHDRLYFVEAKPKIPDRDYDRLLEELRNLEAKRPDLITPNSPTQRVGGTPIKGFDSVAHTQPMLSIDNTYDQEELNAWHQRARKRLKLDRQMIELVLEPKIDGVAINLRYENGLLALALTRGDGQRGDDITANVKTIRSIPLKLVDTEHKAIPQIPPLLEVRGEIYMTHSDFDHINRQRAIDGVETYANPRNFTSGTLKQLDPTVVEQRPLQFCAHGRGVITPDPFKTHQEFLVSIRTWGLPTNHQMTLVSTIEQAWEMIQVFDQQRTSLDYGTDGVVVKFNRYDMQQILGATSKAPRWCIAYKFAAEQAVTRLLKVDWQVGKTGRLTPRATMKPVLIAGTTVRHASLHNADEISRKDVRVGDQVVIEKAGEIIPQVVRVELDGRPKDARPIKPPSLCPGCGEPTVREEVEVDIRCINPDCPAQIRERLIWLCGRDQLNIEGLGEKAVQQLADAGLLESLGDVFELHQHRDELMQLDRMGEKKVDNLISAIETSKKAGLARVLAGLGIRHVGSRAAGLLALHFGSLDSLSQATTDQLSEIDEIGPITAQSVHEFFRHRVGKRIKADLKRAGIKLTEKRPTTSTVSTFNGKTIVITGTFEHFDRKELKTQLEARGAKVTSSISAKTDMVVVGDNAGTKLAKARTLKIELWSEQELLKRLDDV